MANIQQTYGIMAMQKGTFSVGCVLAEQVNLKMTFLDKQLFLDEVAAWLAPVVIACVL